MTQFKSNYNNLCLIAANKSGSNINADYCWKEGANWTIVGGYLNAKKIQSEYGLCLTVKSNTKQLYYGDCSNLDNEWRLGLGQIKSEHSNGAFCLAVTGSKVSPVALSFCVDANGNISDKKTIWTLVGGEDAPEIVKTNSVSLLNQESYSSQKDQDDTKQLLQDSDKPYDPQGGSEKDIPYHYESELKQNNDYASIYHEGL